MTKSAIPILCLSLIIHPVATSAVDYAQSIGNHELYAEFNDPYVASLGIYFSLVKSQLPALDAKSEREIYRNLMSNFFSPNAFLIETSTYPLPLAGAAIKAWKKPWYDRSTIGSMNIIRTLTESVNFPEPWALSFFLGYSADFKNEASAFEGKGNTGLLCSYGYYHIKDNSIYPDHWGECEVKLKVDKSGKERRYATSYRIGAKIHSHPDIKDLMYLSLSRDRTDFDESGFSLIRNTNIKIRGDFSIQPVEFVRLILEGGKKFPFSIGKHRFALGLSLGLICTVHNPYSGELGNDFVGGTVSPVIRPLLQF